MIKKNSQDIAELKGVIEDFDSREHLRRVNGLNDIAKIESRQNPVNFSRVRFITQLVRDQLDQYVLQKA